MNLAKTNKEVPEGEHYAIVVFHKTSKLVYDDDPWYQPHYGHSRPTHTEDFCYCQYFHTTDKAEWEQEVKKLHSDKMDFAAFRAGKPAVVKVDVSIE
jgi:hypothetical protein